MARQLVDGRSTAIAWRWRVHPTITSTCPELIRGWQQAW